MGYSRQHQQGTNGELFRAIVTQQKREWRPREGYVDVPGETEEIVYGPYTTAKAAKNAASQTHWPRTKAEDVRVEKLVSPVWAPVNKRAEITITDDEYLELQALRAELASRGYEISSMTKLAAR